MRIQVLCFKYTTVGFWFAFWRDYRKYHLEGAAFAENALGGDCSPVLFDNTPADGQPDARAFVNVTRMQALKNAENP